MHVTCKGLAKDMLGTMGHTSDILGTYWGHVEVTGNPQVVIFWLFKFIQNLTSYLITLFIPFI